MTLTGNIIDVQTQQPIPNAVVQEATFDTASNTLHPFGPIQNITGSNYSLNVNSLSSDQYFQFTAPGYNLYYANDLSLASSPTVQLLKDTEANKNLLLAGGALAFLYLVRNKKREVGKLETKDVIPYLLIGGVLIAGGFLKSILEKFGLISNAAVAKEGSNPNSFWNPLFYQVYSTFTKTIDTPTATADAKKIYDAFTPIGYYVEDIIAVIHSLQTQSEVSFLAKVFNDVYGKDLYNFLVNGWWPGDHLSTDEILQLNNYISQLPTN